MDNIKKIKLNSSKIILIFTFIITNLYLLMLYSNQNEQVDVSFLKGMWISESIVLDLEKYHSITNALRNNLYNWVITYNNYDEYYTYLKANCHEGYQDTIYKKLVKKKGNKIILNKMDSIYFINNKSFLDFEKRKFIKISDYSYSKDEEILDTISQYFIKKLFRKTFYDIHNKNIKIVNNTFFNAEQIANIKLIIIHEFGLDYNFDDEFLNDFLILNYKTKNDTLGYRIKNDTLYFYDRIIKNREMTFKLKYKFINIRK